MASQYHNNGDVFQCDTVFGSINASTSILYAAPAPEQKYVFISARDPVANFTGRKRELNVLANTLQHQASPRAVVVSGHGGIGKTQLVRKYIYDYRLAYKNVIWITAITEELIIESFKKLAKDRLKISLIDADGGNKDFSSVLDEVHNELCKTKSLFVYDNVETMDKTLWDAVNATASKVKPDVIITSRVEDWDESFFFVIRLMAWNQMEAIEFLSKSLKADDDDDRQDDKKMLIDTLEQFPLAIKQATSYINYQRKKNDFTISNYVQKHKSVSIRYEYDGLNQSDRQYDNAAYKTWSIAVNAMKQEKSCGLLAIKILNVIAYFDAEDIHSDSLIHLVLMNTKETCSESFDFENQLSAAVDLLVNYGMITSLETNKNVLSIHRLIQNTIKHELEENQQEMAVLRDGLALVEHQMMHVAQMNHAISVFNAALHLDDLIKEFGMLPIKILINLITCYQHPKAKTFALTILDRMVSIFGADSTIVGCLRFHVAIAEKMLNIRGKVNEDDRKYIGLYEQLYELRVVDIGSDHEDTLSLKDTIGRLFVEFRKPDDALKIFEEVYEKEKLILGEDHPQTLTTRSNIVLVYVARGRHEEAINLFSEIYEKQKLLYGESHPAILINKLNIATSYQQLGMYIKAIDTYTEVWTKYKEILGEDHPCTIEANFNLAMCYASQSKHAKCLNLCTKIYVQRCASLGADHTETIDTKLCIANSYRKLGNAKAIDLYQEIYEQKKRMFGEKHPQTVLAIPKIIICLSEKGMHGRAIELYEGWCEELDNILDAGNESLLFTKAMVAASYNKLDMNGRAILIYQNVSDILEQNSGPYTPEILNIKFNLASSYVQHERHADAIDVCVDVYEKRKIVLGEYHPSTLTTKLLLAFSYRKAGMCDNALEQFYGLLQSQERVYGKNHLETFTAKINIAETLIDQLKVPEAVAMFEDMYGIVKDTLGEFNAETSKVKVLLDSSKKLLQNSQPK